MARTLAHDVILPEDGDPGSSWFQNLEKVIEQFATHNHDGGNSERINTGTFTAHIEQISVADLQGGVAQANGGFRYDFALSVDINLENRALIFRDSVTKEQMFLRHEHTGNAASPIAVWINIPTAIEVLVV